MNAIFQIPEIMRMKISASSPYQLPYIVIETSTRPLRFIIDSGAEFSIVNPNIINPKMKIILKVLGRIHRI